MLYRQRWSVRCVPVVRILVQFGARKEYAAIVTRVLEAPDETELKYLISVLDEYPVVLEHQLLQWSWMASYYMAPVGDVMNAALPPGLKLSSQSVVVLDPEVVPDESSMSDALFRVVRGLAQPSRNSRLTRFANIVK